VQNIRGLGCICGIDSAVEVETERYARWQNVVFGVSEIIFMIIKD